MNNLPEIYIKRSNVEAFKIKFMKKILDPIL